ncbi:class I heat shock protein [Sesamum angolense]|uniref:Class I heat shock protein n=1 Tax=Sesamum angolense TaxID=2727404 RepID=A0AAE1WA29_9LAMI|nr:class I heat shock protein [Sesamum angolense]
MVETDSYRWKAATVGYFLGKKSYFYHLNAFVRSTWPALVKITTTVNDFYYFKFESIATIEEAIEVGPWLFQRQPIILQKQDPRMELRKQSHNLGDLVWIKLHNLLVELWMDEGLSVVANGVKQVLHEGRGTSGSNTPWTTYSPNCYYVEFDLEVGTEFRKLSDNLHSNFPSSFEATSLSHAMVNWKETPNAYVFKADNPAKRKEDVKVGLEDDRILHINWKMTGS